MIEYCIFDQVFPLKSRTFHVFRSIEYHEFICTKRERKLDRGEPLSESDLSAGAYDHPWGPRGAFVRSLSTKRLKPQHE